MEFRRNHFYKPLIWKLDNSLYPGQVFDSFVANSRYGSGYSAATTCSISPPQSGTTAQCSPVLSFPLTSIHGTGTTATATCTFSCSSPVNVGDTIVISGNSVGGFNTTITVLTLSTLSFTFSSATSGTGTGGSALTTKILDVFVCPTAPCTASSAAGSGYGIGTKGNGNIYAVGPNFYFTDGGTTYA